MSDSTSTLDLVSQSQAQKEATVNALLDAMSNAVLFGNRKSTTGGLTWGYYGGVASVSGEPTRIDNGTVALTTSTTNYVYAEMTGSPDGWTVIVTTSIPSGWPGPLTGDKIALYEVVTGVSTITSWEDWRTSAAATGGGGGSVPTGTGFRHVTSGSEDGAAVAVNLSGSDATGTLAAGRFPALTGPVTTVAGALATTQAVVIQAAVTDESTTITTGTAKLTFRMPHAMTLTAVRASLTTTSSSGVPTINIKESGTTIFSTKITIDVGQTTSTTASIAAVISDASLADDAVITVDIDVAGTGATGLKIALIGTRS